MPEEQTLKFNHSGYGVEVKHIGTSEHVITLVCDVKQFFFFGPVEKVVTRYVGYGTAWNTFPEFTYVSAMMQNTLYNVWKHARYIIEHQEPKNPEEQTNGVDTYTPGG